MRKFVSLLFLLLASASVYAVGGPGCDPTDPSCVSTVPEPEILGLFAIGALGLLISRIKK